MGGWVGEGMYNPSQIGYICIMSECLEHSL